jgi:hypothetical protein
MEGFSLLGPLVIRGRAEDDAVQPHCKKLAFLPLPFLPILPSGPKRTDRLNFDPRHHITLAVLTLNSPSQLGRWFGALAYSLRLKPAIALGSISSGSPSGDNLIHDSNTDPLAGIRWPSHRRKTCFRYKALGLDPLPSAAAFPAQRLRTHCPESGTIRKTTL